ncbi:gas vesicle protein [Streptomyces sp. DSM 42041]|uniref:Gas vesicle protein n=1 Tax=Streptomyces hazeniae TaxID=3075538 RepID=A0ABU2NZD4_9ACTN|nr:gas vesicle protein [Streptomyces sp. DSM 42041]MDT0382346.1 gas vesicle protein [Streptomyces sp. DSM 42041]
MAAEQRERRSRSAESSARASGGRARSGSRTGARAAVGAREAAEQAGEILGALVDGPVEGISGVCRTEEGWRVGVDVLELSRIPDTTSLLATYEVDLDRDGDLLEYCRTRRFRRGAADGE